MHRALPGGKKIANHDRDLEAFSMLRPGHMYALLRPRRTHKFGTQNCDSGFITLINKIISQRILYQQHVDWSHFDGRY